MNIKQFKLVYKNKSLLPTIQVEKRISIDRPCQDLSKEENLYYLINKSMPIKRDYVEKMYVIAMDIDMYLIGIFELSKGNHVECNVYMKELFMFLLLSGASNFMLVHNHPNGYDGFSKKDIDVLQTASSYAEFFNIKLEDAIVLTQNTVSVASEEGIL